MDEQPRMRPPRPGGSERKATRGQVLLRRAVAAVLLFAFLGLAL